MADALHGRQRARGTTTAADRTEAAPSPGKQSNSEMLGSGSNGPYAGTLFDVQAVADAGLGGAGHALPYLDAIQRSFGAEHDVGTIRAHVGGGAADAAHTIGAEAYATGDRVAFATNPDLHTAAHEAAHVIQQQAGVQLEGGVGAVGDTYEREADEIANAVVAGRSAAPMLAKYAGTSGGTAGVQMKKDVKAPVIEERTLLEVSGQLDAICRRRESRARTGPYALALVHLEWAMSDDGPIGNDITARLASLNAALAQLRPVLSAMKADRRWVWWLQTSGVERKLAEVREQLNEQKAEVRITAATEASAAKPTEPTGDKSEGQKLQSAIKLHLKATAKLTDIANNLIGAAEPGALDSKTRKELLKAKGALGLDVVNDTLGVVSAYLDLTDEEFEKKRSQLAGLPGMTKAKTRLEFYKACGELLKSGVGATSKTARLIALQLGKTDLAANLQQVADSKVLGNVVSVVTIVHSACVLLDDRSTDQDKLDAVAEGTSAALTLAGAAGLGFAVGTAYVAAKLAAQLYWAARSSVTAAYTGAAFDTLTIESGLLVRRLERLVVTGSLLAAEHDADQQAALAKQEQEQSEQLGRQIDRFLEKAAQRVHDRQPGGPSLASYPGNHQTLREIFQPLQRLQGRTAPGEVLDAATTLVDTITGCFEDADMIVGAELQGGGAEKLDEMRKKKAKERDQERSDEAARKQEIVDEWLDPAVCDAHGD